MSYNYIPQTPKERACYDGLWSAATTGGSGSDLSGAQAVAFFKLSGVDLKVLKQIWEFSTNGATMSIDQFYNALRYIQMYQNGDFPLTKERLQVSEKLELELPKFNGVVIPPPFPGITPETHAKYHALFAGYDTDGDGFLSGAESVAVFSKSGLNKDVLKAIWVLADRDQDNQLTSKEFCVAFHLIICVGKQGLALPSSLPPPLLAFLTSAPDVPRPSPAPAPSTQPAVLEAAPMPSSSSPMPASAAVSMKPPSSSPAFAVAAVATISASDEAALTASVETLKDSSRRALDVLGQSDEAVSTVANSIRKLVEKLTTEKISLTASVKAAESAATSSQQKLEQAVQDVAGLQSDLASLREQMEKAHETQVSAQSRLAGVMVEKQGLLQQIDDMRRQIAEASLDMSSVASQIGDASADTASTEGRLAALSSEANTLKSDISSANNELATLRTLLNSLSGDKGKLSSELEMLQTKLNSSQAQLKQQQDAMVIKEREVDQYRAEKESLTREKKELLDALISAKSSTASAVAAAVETATAAATAAAAASVVSSPPPTLIATTSSVASSAPPPLPSSPPPQLATTPTQEAKPAAVVKRQSPPPVPLVAIPVKPSRPAKSTPTTPVAAVVEAPPKTSLAEQDDASSDEFDSGLALGEDEKEEAPGPSAAVQKEAEFAPFEDDFGSSDGGGFAKSAFDSEPFPDSGDPFASQSNATAPVADGFGDTSAFGGEPFPSSASTASASEGSGFGDDDKGFAPFGDDSEFPAVAPGSSDFAPFGEEDTGSTSENAPFASTAASDGFGASFATEGGADAFASSSPFDAPAAGGEGTSSSSSSASPFDSFGASFGTDDPFGSDAPAANGNAGATSPSPFDSFSSFGGEDDAPSRETFGAFDGDVKSDAFAAFK